MRPSARRRLSLALLLPALLFALPANPEVPPAPESGWTAATLAGLDLEAKVAQMIMVRAYAVPRHPQDEEQVELAAQIRDLGVGGVALSRSELDTIPGFLDELQALARVPLWVAADVERGLAMRVPSGPVALPDAMAIGAIPGADGEAAARFAGELTARECRAAGIHWAFAPVADVNSNPANPIINLRSFGEDPDRVAKLVAAFVEGAHAGRLLTTAKHFPGHGDTAIDSHLALPVLDRSRDELERVDLPPFRAAIAAGVDSVMTGHLSVPALDATGTPATLSRPITTDLLRGELGFDGLIVTDALEMSGVGDVWMGEAAVEAVAAGADVVLLPPDPRVAIQSIVRAVREGRIDESRIDRSVARILAAKEWLGLADPTSAAGRRPGEAERLHDEIGRPDDAARTDEIAARAVTLVRDREAILPLRVEEPLRILHLVSSSDWVQSSAAGGGGEVGDGIAARGIEVTTRRIGPALPAAIADEIVSQAPQFTHVLVSAFVRVTSSKGSVDMDPTHAALLERLAAAGTKLVVVSFASPYLLAQFPHVPAYLCTFSPSPASQRAAVAAIFGEAPIGGRLPVTLPGLAARGEGIARPRRALELAAATPEAAGFRAEGLAALDRVIERFVDAHAFPGAVIAVGRHGKLAHLRAFGRLTYDDDAPAARTDTIYDMASVTKVVVTTTLVMMMVDEGRLDLDAPVQSFLPGFVGRDKERVTVRHLLTHSSGIDWWAPLYRELHGKEEYLRRIEAMELVSEPGTKTMYSDLGILLLGEIVERVSGRTLDALAGERIFAPLGMTRTGYRPAASLVPEIAPTEIVAERGGLVHGVVHDENAAGLDGVAPHAGLFSTAPDLARFAQMLLWHGVYDHHRFVKRATLDEFTRPANLPEGSSRGLGWDTKSPTGSSAGILFSPDSFGHTGFTGTSIWIDPTRDLFVVLLTNRVHPTRDNHLIREARPAIHDAVVRALVDAPPVVRVGLDRVDQGEDAILRGKRVGLVTHAAAVTVDGRSAIEVLRGRGIDLVRLFSPEHGLRSRAAAGEKVASGTDPGTGLPVVSLYGDHRKPTPDDLAGLDTLVVDLQDAGVRFFTYSSTLLLCLEAAAEAGIEIVVLDRPDPLGGEYVAGPFADPRDELAATFLSMAPGTLVHGLTLGEMARYANSLRVLPARLTVVPMAGWKRRMTWTDTGREWVAPSPNLRSAAAAVAYPGVALLEATNVSEGRGTDSPFLLFGAPWLDPGAVHVESPGFRLVPARFTPQGSPAAPEPKYRDQECRGFRVEVTDPTVADPWRLGLDLLAALSRLDGFAWLREGEALATLVGSRGLRERFAPPPRRTGVADGSSADRAAAARWRRERRSALLYD
ncbi:MAG: glycoside hydrolase family 3 N-terminal domain-containing protein [Thermoanaerobaculia bacterium]